MRTAAVARSRHTIDTGAGWRAAGAVALALVLGWNAAALAAPRGLPGYALPAIAPAADVPVLTSQGAETTLHALLGGKLVVLSLIYSHCNDARGCPWATGVLHMLARRLASDPALAGQVRLISLSFDPRRDTPEVMRRYGASFSSAADWVFATLGTDAALPILAGHYGQRLIAEQGPQGKTSGAITHLLRVFLIDKTRAIRNIYSASLLDATRVESDLRLLAGEPKMGEGAAGRERGPAPTVAPLPVEGPPPLGLPPVPVLPDNPLSVDKVELGRKLFFDRRMSLNGTLSCAMCHIPEQGFTSNELATPVGMEGRSVRRNTPSLFNVAYAQRLFHDGRERALETQVWSPLLAMNEMAAPSVGWVIERIAALRDYTGRFERAFGRAVSMGGIGAALASYQRTLVSGGSAFDRWYFAKDRKALNDAARRGFRIFTGPAGCVVCHRIDKGYALFTDQGLHSNGIGWARAMRGSGKDIDLSLAPGLTVRLPGAALESVSERLAHDLGRYEVTQRPEDRWLYKTPGLRNVALTAPYMHDGSLASLDDVLAFYDRGGIPGPYTDPLLKPLGLSPAQRSDLRAFLESLTGENVAALIAYARAGGR
ncbi:MAG: cytochrome c peroxidase [Gammaproteobacteria bacterium]